MRNDVAAMIQEMSKQCLRRCQAIARLRRYYDPTEDEMKNFDSVFPRIFRGSFEGSKAYKHSCVFEILAEKWAGRFLVYSDGAGNRTFFRRNVHNNTVDEISIDELQRQAALVFSGTEMDCCAKDALERANGWVDRTDYLEKMPSSFAWANDPRLTFNRFDFDVQNTPTPLFDDFLSRIATNQEALMAYIWSIFEPKDKGQQYLWIHGQGLDGKGSLMRFLAALVGRGYAALDGKDKYWLAACVGKRLGVFNDVVNTTIPMTSQFKQVTGGDMVNIEQKYKKSYSTALDVKFIFTTNRDLQISSELSNLRRCIYVSMLPNPNKPSRDYEERLWKERAGILFKCRQVYERLVDECGVIKFDVTPALDVAEDLETKFAILFTEHLIADPECYVRRNSLFDLMTMQQNSKMSHQEFSEFKGWLKRTHNVQEDRIKKDGGKVKIYRGIGLKVNRYDSLEKTVIKHDD